MSDEELVRALNRIADIGIVHYSEAEILREAAERIEILGERLAIIQEGREYEQTEEAGAGHPAG